MSVVQLSGFRPYPALRFGTVSTEATQAFREALTAGKVMEANNIRETQIDHKEEIQLPGIILTNANLSHANLSRTNLSWADLSRTNLSWADLSHANLSHANLIGANLSHANLSHANLSHANLSHANLSHAQLTGATINATYFTSANLENANLTNAWFDPNSSPPILTDASSNGRTILPSQIEKTPGGDLDILA